MDTGSLDGMMRWFFVLAFVLAATAAGNTAFAAGIELLSHRALYRMSLAEAAGRSQVIAGDGRMMYQVARGCDGWTVENQTFLRLTYDDGRETETIWTFASWESADGLDFRFRARYEQNGNTIERLTGAARLERVGGTGQATFADPEDTVVPLPEGTMFPTAHMHAVLDAAVAGQRTLSRVVFDGASLDNPYSVNAVFGLLPEDQALDMAEAASLPPVPSWWAQMAFFPVANRQSLPEFEVSGRYRTDGVTDKLTQDFGDFALKVDLAGC